MAIDFSSVSAGVDFSSVGGAILLIAGGMAAVHAIHWGVKKVLALIGGGDDYDPEGFSDDDYWNGYTSEDDARDVAAHNAAGSAYDAGYYGREFDPEWGEGARASHAQAQADRQEDLAKGWK